jgi:hypothetical protein
MELEPIKSPPYSGFNKILGNVGVSTLAVMLLLIVAVQYWRSADASFDRLFLSAAAVGIAAIGFSYLNFRRALNRIDGRIDEAVVYKLLVAANSIAIFGYTACMALLSVHHH